MGLNKEILRITARYHPMVYAQLFEYLYDETVYGKKLNKSSLSSTLNRMKRDGLLKKQDDKWSITSEGRLRETRGNADIKKFSKREKARENRNKPKRLMVIFDIPEKKKRYREWLRSELVVFGFTLIQKSVWFGPGVPKEFVEYLDEVDMLKHVRFFKTSETDLI